MSARVLRLLTVAALVLATGAAASLRWGPLAPVVDARRGVRALADGRPAEAIPSLERSASGDPSGATLYHLGTARLELGDAAVAAEVFDRALSNVEGPELKRRLLHNLARARLDEALGAAPGLALPHALASVAAGREALRLRPDSPGTRRNLALAQRLVAGARSDPDEGPRDGGVQLRGAGGGADGGRGSGPSTADAEAILDALRAFEAEDLRQLTARQSAGSFLERRSEGPPW